MKLNFRLKDKSKVSSYLFADILYKNIRVKHSIGISIKTSLFDENKQRLRGNSDEISQFNLLITKYESEILSLLRNVQYDGEISAIELKRKLNELFNKKDVSKYFTDFIADHIQTAKVTKKPRTILHYKTTQNKILAYEQEIKTKLTFNDITHEFYSAFILYCKETLKLAPNTLGGHIKNIKVFMNIATDKGLNKNLAFKKSFFRRIEEDIDAVYLDEEELTKIKNTNLDTKKLDHSRDLFLIGCYTGLRISDYGKVHNRNIISDGKILKITTEKTDEDVYIPLNPIVLSILTKYNGEIRMISHQKFNTYVKDVCRLSKIEQMLTIKKTKGSQTQIITLPKYKLVTSHTARRSFATNAFKAGLPSISIMKITGHRTEKNFLKYIRITKEENAKLISEHAFFK
jgi:integrase